MGNCCTISDIYSVVYSRCGLRKMSIDLKSRKGFVKEMNKQFRSQRSLHQKFEGCDYNEEPYYGILGLENAFRYHILRILRKNYVERQ